MSNDLFDGLDLDLTTDAPTVADSDAAMLTGMVLPMAELVADQLAVDLDLPVGLEVGLAPPQEPEVLAADYGLPDLPTFVPNTALRDACDALAVEAKKLDVTAADGLIKAAPAMVNLRTAIGAIELNFSRATQQAYERHRRLTALRSEFLNLGNEALSDLERRVLAETARRRQLSDAAKAVAQEVANAVTREVAAHAAVSAKRAGAPPAVVEKLEEQAKTAVAAPVAAPPSAELAGSTETSTPKVRLKGTPADADNDARKVKVKDMNDAQRASLIQLMKAAIEGKVPLSFVKELDWGYLDTRAAAEGATFNLPGLEIWHKPGLRAKPGSRK